MCGCYAEVDNTEEDGHCPVPRWHMRINSAHEVWTGHSSLIRVLGCGSVHDTSWGVSCHVLEQEAHN